MEIGLPSMQIKHTHSFFPLSGGKPIARAKILNGILPLHAIFLFSWYLEKSHV